MAMLKKMLKWNIILIINKTITLPPGLYVGILILIFNTFLIEMIKTIKKIIVKYS